MDSLTMTIGAVVVLVCAALATRAAKAFARRTITDATASIESAESVRKNAQRQREMILEEALSTAREQFKSDGERLDEERAVVQRIQVDFEQELNQRQSQIDKEFHELNVKEQALKQRLQNAIGRFEDVKKIEEEKRGVEEKLVEHLSQKTSVKKDDVLENLREEFLNAEKLGITGWFRENQESLKTSAQRFAKDVLATVTARYSPTFVWPKTTFSVQLPSKDIFAKHFGDGSPLVATLLDGTMSTIEFMIEEQEAPTVKISGGAGIDKEMIRLTLEEMVNRNWYSVEKAKDLLVKYQKQIDRLILKLGQEAMKTLELPAAHPEILKMIGMLNYRTSHRQNQYYHTIEVARLAGMLADEVGVDRNLAKRSGLLHDIGKSLDYRIEGSHAVISGDYAARFGESVDVVDTVLSHHDDKIVETPFAFILKAADAMSGARPGARVDMEEGYQKRIESIAEVIKSFRPRGIVDSAIMSAGREVHIFVDNGKIKERDAEPLAVDIARKLESDVEFPGQIKVTIIRRTEVSEVA